LYALSKYSNGSRSKADSGLDNKGQMSFPSRALSGSYSEQNRANVGTTSIGRQRFGKFGPLVFVQAIGQSRALEPRPRKYES
jgi:hypothetical protein